jgi:hypothetical protein
MAQKVINLPQCAECNVKNKICTQEAGHGPDFCPTINFDMVVKDSLLAYQRQEIKKFALYATPFRRVNVMQIGAHKTPMLCILPRPGFRRQLNLQIN